jgi:hypothetical protein
MIIGKKSMNKKDKMDRDWDSFLPFHSQWYWQTSNIHPYEKSKAFYHGPRIEWMNLVDTNEKKDTKKDSR